MSAPASQPAISFWRRVIGAIARWIAALGSLGQRVLGAGKVLQLEDGTAGQDRSKRPLPEAFSDLEGSLPTYGAVADVISRTLDDYRTLHHVLLGVPEELQSEALDFLGAITGEVRSLLEDAPRVHELAQVTIESAPETVARRASGEAVLLLADRQKVLRSLATKAVAWAASREHSAQEFAELCSGLATS